MSVFASHFFFSLENLQFSMLLSEVRRDDESTVTSYNVSKFRRFSDFRNEMLLLINLTIQGRKVNG